MIKKVWDRRRRQERRHIAANDIILPHGVKSKAPRKKGVRRRKAASLLLGLSTVMPVPGAKLIHPGSAKVKKSNVVAGSTIKKGEIITLSSLLNPNGEIELWTPPSFEDEISKGERSSVAPVGIDIFLPKDLMPDFSYSDVVVPLSMKYDVDWRLVAAVIQAESGFNPDAVSPVGARGLMQLMPATAADYGVTLKTIHDPETNVEAGIRHLKRLSRLYDGDIPLIAAAYNAGQGTVAKFEGIPPFEETRTYVERVISYYHSFSG